MALKRIVIVALGALAVGQMSFAMQAGAADAPSSDPVAATVNGYAIRLSDVEDAQGLLPAQMQGQPFQAVYPILLNSLINSRLAAEKARAEGLEKDPAFKKRMARIADQLLERMLLSRHIESQVTDALVRERYDALVEKAKTQFEVNARHVLLKTEAEALDVIKALQGGADFAELAMEHSTGPSGPSGGDLGWFGPGRMVPAFDAAAQALKTGSFTDKPVKTQFGWHVIKVEERRPLSVASFEQARPGLVNALSGEMGQALMNELRDGATVEQKELSGLK